MLPARSRISGRDPNIEEGENLDQADGTPRYWQRSSFGGRMAQVMKLPPPEQGNAVVILDDDLHQSGTWQAESQLENPTPATETLRLEWREAFSVGIGGRLRFGLPPGDYVFRVKTVTPSASRSVARWPWPFRFRRCSGNVLPL